MNYEINPGESYEPVVKLAWAEDAPGMFYLRPINVLSRTRDRPEFAAVCFIPSAARWQVTVMDRKIYEDRTISEAKTRAEKGLYILWKDLQEIFQPNVKTTQDK